MKELRVVEKTFKVLGDQVNLRILKILEEQQLCVCEIMDILNISQSTASKKLSELKDIGLVLNKKESKWTVYFINNEELNRYHIALSDLIKSWLNDDETVQKDKQRIKHVKETSKRACAIKNIVLEDEYV